MIGSFCANYTTFELKKYRGVIFMTLKSLILIGKMTLKKLILVWKMTKIWQIFIKILEFQNWYFHGIENAWAATYRGVISKDTEEWLKIWRGIDLSFQNWNKEFDKFKLKNLKVSKIYTLMGCMTLKNNEKSEEELTCRFKIYIKNFCINSNNWIFYKYKKLK